MALTIPVKQRTPEWLEAREHGIGASQAAAAIGMSEWQSPVGLWAEKLGLVPPATETLPMRIGAELEPLIARLYQEATGTKVRRVNMLRQHPQHTFMLASLDRRAGKRPIELKYSLRGTGYGEPGTDEVPDDVLIQVLHQLAVMDEDEADVAAIIGGRPDVQIFTIARNADVEARIIEREAIFWDHVQSRTEPPVDGSEATRRALAALYPRDTGETVIADEVTGEWLREYGEATAAIKHFEAVKLKARNHVTDFMATATRLVAPGVGEVTYKTTKDVETVKWEAVAAAYRNELAAIAMVIETKPDWPSLELYASRIRHELSDDPDAITTVALHTTTTEGDRRFGPPRYIKEETPA